MSASRAIPVARNCSQCRASALNTFISFSGLSRRPQTIYATVALRGVSFTRFQNYSTSGRKCNEATWRPSDVLEAVKEAEDAENAVKLKSTPTEVEAKTTSTEDFLPWYLRDQSSEQSSISPLKKQQLPELPPKPPEKLLPILERLSIDIGLDDLKLIDLRNLDPPPALGSNLLMIIGSARSEKHLHVSADRFCRWLRTEYKMTPYADGLLGRNELKLKMKRKARRTRLMGSTNSTRKSDEDDGIRTNWVCVNAGSIEDSKGIERSLEDSGIIGFGGREDGVKLVVQIMTDEKREGLGLEYLWNGFIERQARAEARDAAMTPEEIKKLGMLVDEVGHGHNLSKAPVADLFSFSSHSPRAPSGTNLSQVRGFHSSSRRLFSDTPATTEKKDAKVRHDKPLPTLAAATSKLGSSVTIEESDSLINQLSYLESLSREEALGALGKDADDRGSTAFLAKFYSLIPLFPQSKHWRARLALIHYGINLGHPGYTVEDLIQFLQRVQESAAGISAATFAATIDSITQSYIDGLEDGSASTSDPMSLLHSVIDLIDDACLRGMDVTTATFLHRLWDAYKLARAVDLTSPTPTFRTDASHRLTRLMWRFKVPAPSTHLHAMALDDLASASDWAGFWRYWSDIAIHMERRPQMLYTAMFTHVSRTWHQANCVKALSNGILEMEMEEPKVNLTADLAQAVMNCLIVADPDVDMQARDKSNEKGQWVKLWRRCELGLEEPAEAASA